MNFQNCFEIVSNSDGEAIYRELQNLKKSFFNSLEFVRIHLHNKPEEMEILLLQFKFSLENLENFLGMYGGRVNKIPSIIHEAEDLHYMIFLGYNNLINHASNQPNQPRC